MKNELVNVIEEREVFGKEFKIYGTVEAPLFLAKDIAECIDYSKTGKGSYDVSKMIKTVDDDEKTMGIVSTFGGIQKVWFLTENGLKQVLVNSRKHKAKELLNLIEDRYKYKKTPKETEFISELELALKPFNLKGQTQYAVFNYRIDYYIPELNIAIEYDENDHKGYTCEKQELRQKRIENELGCRFIRVSDKDSNAYNVGLVIKEMFMLEVA